MSSGLERVTSVDDLADGPARVEVDGKKYLVHRGENDIKAYRNVCPHQYGPVLEGRVDAAKDEVICPWHGWSFDLDTGENPLIDMRLSRVEVIVESDDVYLDI